MRVRCWACVNSMHKSMVRQCIYYVKPSLYSISKVMKLQSRMGIYVRRSEEKWRMGLFVLDGEREGGKFLRVPVVHGPPPLFLSHLW